MALATTQSTRPHDSHTQKEGKKLGFAEPLTSSSNIKQIYETKGQRESSSSSNTQNVAFVSSNTPAVQMEQLIPAHGVTTDALKLLLLTQQTFNNLSMPVIVSFLGQVNQQSKLDNDDLQQLNLMF
ncbi:hypothetical protein Tco_0585063 [Tanacetum coccineum]